MMSVSIVLLIVLNNVESVIYNTQNSTQIFHFYKDKYHKVYKSKRAEKRAFGNFVKNLNRITALNENTLGNDTIYVLNKYADINQGNFEEHYALNITPYDITKLHREFTKPTDGLRNRIEPKPEPKNIDTIDLYDLDHADKLYKNYMQKFNKKNSTKAYERTVHYYRFLKTLVEMNRNHYKGIKQKLDDNADVVKYPDYYFY